MPGICKLILDFIFVAYSKIYWPLGQNSKKKFLKTPNIAEMPLHSYSIEQRALCDVRWKRYRWNLHRCGLPIINNLCTTISIAIIILICWHAAILTIAIELINKLLAEYLAFKKWIGMELNVCFVGKNEEPHSTTSKVYPHPLIDALYTDRFLSLTKCPIVLPLFPSAALDGGDNRCAKTMPHSIGHLWPIWGEPILIVSHSRSHTFLFSTLSSALLEKSDSLNFACSLPSLIDERAFLNERCDCSFFVSLKCDSPWQAEWKGVRMSGNSFPPSKPNLVRTPGPSFIAKRKNLMWNDNFLCKNLHDRKNNYLSHPIDLINSARPRIDQVPSLLK